MQTPWDSGWKRLLNRTHVDPCLFHVILQDCNMLQDIDPARACCPPIFKVYLRLIWGRPPHHQFHSRIGRKILAVFASALGQRLWCFGHTNRNQTSRLTFQNAIDWCWSANVDRYWSWLCNKSAHVDEHLSARHAKPVNYSAHWHRWHRRGVKTWIHLRNPRATKTPKTQAPRFV